jgi:host factor-I protein
MERNERILEAAIMNELVRDKVPVSVFLMNGFQLQGVIARYDLLVIVLVNDDGQQIIYKHSISSIAPHSALKSAQSKT